MLDLCVKLNNGENVNIEMQTYFEERFTTRMLSYWTQLHGQQPRRGQKYDQVKTTYLLAFTTFSVLDGDNYISRIVPTVYGEPDKIACKEFEIVIVELNKFNKSLHELVAMVHRWCYIMKHSAELTAEQVKYLLQDGETQMALEHLEEMSKEDKARWEAISLSRREWEQQLKREALEEKGRVQGMQEGEVNKARGIALSMLQKGYEVSLISEVTGLSIAEIEQLKIREPPIEPSEPAT